ncbi:MAG: outer membrane beta-barrel protein [Ignavibacteriaceae bacterium]
MCKKSLVILIFLLIISESEAQRKSSEGSIGIGPQIGYQRAGDADEGRFMFGGFLRAKLSDAFALDGSINYRTEEYFDGAITVRSWPVLVSALVYPFPMLYGIAGGGWYNTTFDFDEGFQEGDLDDETQTNFGWHLGAGVEIPLAESVMLVGDIKYVFLDYDWEDLSDTPLNDFNSNFYIINVGLSFGLR